MRILVHADDLGLSASVNAAIARACGERRVQSVSALATGPAFDSAWRELPDGTDVGVHLDLTGFPSLTGHPRLAALSELAQAGGEAFLKALDRHAAEAPEVLEAEWLAQVEAVRACAPVSHVDSHQHLHWRPSVWPSLRRVLRRADIRGVRAVAPWRPDASAPRRAMQRARARHFLHAFRDFLPAATPTNPRTFRWLLDGGAPLPSVVELMVHPGNDAHRHYVDEMAWLAERWDQLRASHAPVSWARLVEEAKPAGA